MLRATAIFASAFLLIGAAIAAEEAKEAAPNEAKTGASGSSAAGSDPSDGGSPLETAKTAEKGSLQNPYSTDNTEVVEEGKEIYMAAGCNGCHGGTGGGGMGPPLTNPVWIYGDDGDTLFRIIALGTDLMMEQGYTRIGTEHVQGPMPAQGTIVKSNDDMWKMITWIQSL